MSSRRKRKHFTSTGIDKLSSAGAGGSDTATALPRFTLQNVGDDPIYVICQDEAASAPGDITLATCAYAINGGEAVTESVFDASGNKGPFNLAEWYFKIPVNGHLILNWLE